jgi:hypothetical protein
LVLEVLANLEHLEDQLVLEVQLFLVDLAVLEYLEHLEDQLVLELKDLVVLVHR